MWHFNWIDYVIFSVIGVSTLLSLFRGLLKEIISLVIWIVAAVVAVKFSDGLSHSLEPYIHSATFRYMAAFSALFLGVLVIGVFVTMLIGTLIDKTGMGGFDRLLGVFFGIARGILLVAITLMFLNLNPDMSSQSSIKESQLIPRFQGLVSWLGSFLPEEMHHVSGWMAEKFKETSVPVSIPENVAQPVDGDN